MNTLCPRTRLFLAEKKICEILNKLELEIGGTVKSIDITIREVARSGECIPYVKIDFRLEASNGDELCQKF